MYIPPAFAVTDPDRLAEVISSNSFATLISKDGDSLFASHLPFLHQPQRGEKGTLLSHMARANRHWQLFRENEEVLVIFNGPHAYISPSWYVSEVAVPTWNYVTVHVHGIPRLIETDAEMDHILDQTVAQNEARQPQPWVPNLPSDLKAGLKKAIVGFEIAITRIEGKFKLGQNRSHEDREKMRHVLEKSGDTESIRLAELMKRELP